MRDIQGQGPQTTEKQYALEKVLGQWLGIINRIKIKAQDPTSKYNASLREIALGDVLYVDMNSGSGWNEKANCIGSPLLFLQEANEYDFGLDINFIEKKADRATELYRRLREECQHEKLLPMCNVRTGDNHEILPTIIDWGKRYGLVYCDPDGPENLRMDELAKISRNQNFRFVDLLIRISGTGYKRAKNGSKNDQKYPNLKVALQSINKTKWFIREIREQDPWQWTFLFGTNWPDYKAMANERFYDITSASGAAIFNKISFTIQEQQSFGEMIR